MIGSEYIGIAVLLSRINTDHAMLLRNARIDVSIQ